MPRFPRALMIIHLPALFSLSSAICYFHTHAHTSFHTHCTHRWQLQILIFALSSHAYDQGGPSWLGRVSILQKTFFKASFYMVIEIISASPSTPYKSFPSPPSPIPFHIIYRSDFQCYDGWRSYLCKKQLKVGLADPPKKGAGNLTLWENGL